jgi:hypothetical protein
MYTPPFEDDNDDTDWAVERFITPLKAVCGMNKKNILFKKTGSGNWLINLL